MRFSSTRNSPGFLAIIALLASPLGCDVQDGVDVSADEDVFTLADVPDGGGSDAGDGEIDPNDPCASLTAEGEPPARAAWFNEPGPIFTIEQPVALSFLAPYAVRVPLADASSYTLEIERCDQPAHREKLCYTGAVALPAEECAVKSIRFGLDPEQYRRGTNLYTFTMRLRRGAVLASEDAFTLTLEY
ncbi:hypothetical protein [Polyangium aurulentum]|uniref:hypothetical protein n=1 Tax=Polyangium aurulentum TaxID=2567896 RepID=UPI0010AE778A|nr:hypothetical protein [Polyangium aurulentum]UQA59194.1 hypothetical protein E8A73_001355 [Polyangium aurulentum]